MDLENIPPIEKSLDMTTVWIGSKNEEKSNI